MTLRTLQNNIAWQSIGKRIFSFLLCLFVAFLFLYGYFVSSSIVNVLVRKEIERDIATMGSRISALEAQYLLQKNQITLEFAKEHGFFAVENKYFVARASAASPTLTLNND